MIRPIELSDLRELEGHQDGYPMPNILDPRVFCQIALEDDNGELLGIVYVKKTTEINLIFKRDASPLKRAKAHLEVVPSIEAACALQGLDDAFVFVTNDHYSNILKKVGFVDIRGIPMQYKIGARSWVQARELMRRMQRREQMLLAIDRPLKQTQPSTEEEPLVSLA